MENHPFKKGHFPVSELIARTEIKKQHNLVGG
jgi:hypothetical protein